MVDNTLRYLMIGPVGAGKSLKADLMCIRAPGDPTQYQEAPCSLPEDFINAQLKADSKASHIYREAIEFPKGDVLKELFDESGTLKPGDDNVESNDEVTKESLLNYMRWNEARGGRQKSPGCLASAGCLQWGEDIPHIQHAHRQQAGA